MPLFPLYAFVIAIGVAVAVIGPRRFPVAARSVWRVIVEFKNFLDDANREVDDVVKSAWCEFREGPSQAGASRLDTLIVIAVVAVDAVIFTMPAANNYCRDILLSALR